MTALLFVGAAAGGALVRWQVGLRLPPPLGTLVVNIVGAFALGLVEHWSSPELTVIGVGGLGALTTFSTLSDDLVGLVSRRPLAAVGYLTATFIGGLGAASLGMAIGG